MRPSDRSELPSSHRLTAAGQAAQPSPAPPPSLRHLRKLAEEADARVEQIELPLVASWPAAASRPAAGSGRALRPGVVGDALFRVVVLALALTAAPWRAAAAQFLGPMPVVDVNATGQWVTQLARMTQQINTARDQLSSYRANMVKLGGAGGYHLRGIDAALAQADALMREGRAIGYSLANVDAVFRTTFPGGVVPADYPAERRTQLVRTLETLRGSLNAASATARQLALGTAKLEAMKGQLRGIRSAQQAAELNTTVGLHTAEELTLLRQQMAAIANAQSVFMASQVQRDAQAQAAAERIVDRMAAPKPPRSGVRLRIGGATP